VTKRGKTGSFAFGLILILLGGVFLLDQFYFIDAWDYLWRFWPLILIIIGAAKIIDYLRG
jgi:hypothetical protein